MNELIRGNLKVEWVELGEGLSGDYNPDDPDDIELLRFYVAVLKDGDWEDLDDASYCTNMPVSATPEQRRKGLKKIMDVVYERASSRQSIKKMCERLSWIGVNDV